MPWRDNGLPGVFITFGYNLAEEGRLTLFWQNQGLEPQQDVWVGLVPTQGGQVRWVACNPAPAFAAERDPPGAILESICPLVDAGRVPGYYDVRLAMSDGKDISPVEFPAGQFAVSVDSSGHFSHVDPATALELMIAWGLATPLDVSFGDTARWIGYQLEPADWKSGGAGTLQLYWELNRGLDLWLVRAFQLVLRLSPGDSSEPAMTVSFPVFPQSATARDAASGAVVPIQYPLSLPSDLPSGEYSLDVCLTVADSGQPVPGVQAATGESVECLSLPMTVTAP